MIGDKSTDFSCEFICLSDPWGELGTWDLYLSELYNGRSSKHRIRTAMGSAMLQLAIF